MTSRSPQRKRSNAGAIAVLATISALAIAACGGGSGGAAPPAAPDITPPAAQSSAPAASASAVPTTAVISVTFSEAMDAATLSAASFSLSAAGVAVAGSVSVSGNTALFTPAAALAGGTLYAVTVSTGAKDLAGNALVAEHVWSFTTAAASAARAWSTPVLLESADGQAHTPAVAATSEDAPNGHAQATAVWVQDGSVYANRYQGGVWQGAELVENETIEATAPRVAMAAWGRAVITWGFGFNGVYTVWGNVYDPIPPSAARPLPFSSSYARQLSVGGNANSAQVAFDASGYNSFSVWTQYVPDRQPAAYRPAQQPYLFVPCDVIANCLWIEGDLGWRSTTLLDIGGGEGSEPQVAGYGSGGAVAVWRKYLAGVWASTHSKAAGWAAPVQLALGGSAEMMKVAASADGSSAVALWIDNASSRPTLTASRLAAAAWSAPVAIDNPAGGSSQEPQVAIDASGNAIIVWLQAGHVVARRCLAGALTACGAQTSIEALSGEARFPRLAATPTGDAVVAWKQIGVAGSPPRIYATPFVASSASWGANPVAVGDATSLNEGPEVAIDKRGKATLVWARDEAGKTNVYASRLE